MLSEQVKKALSLSNGKNIIVTIGNPLRMDDGVGAYISSRLKSNDSRIVLDAGSNPENCVDEIVSLCPDRIVFIDAADFGGAPGQARMIAKEDIPDMTFSTHIFPLGAIWEIISQETKARICFIGIQIEDCGFGEGLTAEVKEMADEIIEILSI